MLFCLDKKFRELIQMMLFPKEQLVSRSIPHTQGHGRDLNKITTKTGIKSLCSYGTLPGLFAASQANVM